LNKPFSPSLDWSYKSGEPLILLRTVYHSPWWKFWNVEKEQSYRISHGHSINDSPLSQEELQKEMELIQQKMDSASSVSILVSANVYSSRGGNKISSVRVSRYQSGEEYLTELSGLVVLETKKYAVRLDHEERSILVLKKEKPKKKLKTKSVELDISALKELMKEESNSQVEVAIVSEVGSVKRYKITGVSGILSMEITVNTNLNTISAVSFEYGSINNPGQFVDLNYSMIYDEDVSSRLNTSNFFKEVHGELEVSSALAGYKLYTEL